MAKETSKYDRLNTQITRVHLAYESSRRQSEINERRLLLSSLAMGLSLTALITVPNLILGMTFILINALMIKLTYSYFKTRSKTSNQYSLLNRLLQDRSELNQTRS